MVYKHLGITTKNGYRVLLNKTKLDTFDINYNNQSFILSMILENEYIHHASSKYKNFYDLAITFFAGIDKDIYEFIISHENDLRLIDQSNKDEAHEWCFIFTENMKITQVSETSLNIDYLIYEAKYCLNGGFCPSIYLDNYIDLKDLSNKNKKNTNNQTYISKSDYITSTQLTAEKEDIKRYINNSIYDNYQHIIEKIEYTHNLCKDMCLDIDKKNDKRDKEYNKNFNNILISFITIILALFSLFIYINHTYSKIEKLYQNDISEEISIEDNNLLEENSEYISQLERENEELMYEYIETSTGSSINVTCSNCPTCNLYPVVDRHPSKTSIRIHCTHCGLSTQYFPMNSDSINMCIEQWNELTKLIETDE